MTIWVPAYVVNGEMTLTGHGVGFKSEDACWRFMVEQGFADIDYGSRFAVQQTYFPTSIRIAE